jgi:hypothetical protein
LADRYTEYRYRLLHSGLTHWQYEEEPAETVGWDIAFAAMDNRRERDAHEKALRDAERKRGH